MNNDMKATIWRRHPKYEELDDIVETIDYDPAVHIDLVLLMDRHEVWAGGRGADCYVVLAPERPDGAAPSRVDDPDATPRVPEPIEGTISPWMPITNQIHLAVLGKLGEECCELGARLFRTVIQGLDEKDPASTRTNREEISREIADVEATLSWLRDEMHIMADGDRMIGKRKGFSRWMRKLRNILDGGDGSVE